MFSHSTIQNISSPKNPHISTIMHSLHGSINNNNKNQMSIIQAYLTRPFSFIIHNRVKYVFGRSSFSEFWN